MSDENQPVPPSIEMPPRQPPPEHRSGVKKALAPFAVLAAILLKFKGFIILALKFAPTLFSMFISIWVYAMYWGWKFAVGFVLLIFVHECGHLLVAKKLGLRVGAPMFIPFVGALIALKEMPRNAWNEAWVGIGGPLLGGLGSAFCYLIYLQSGNDLFGALAYTGFFINLFNMAPIGFLDGGRIVTALSPWFWLIGTVIIGAMMFFHFNFLLLLIFIMSLPRLFSLFRAKSDQERRYYEVAPMQRLIMGGMYFGLIAFLVAGMFLSTVHVQEQAPPPSSSETITYDVGALSARI